MTTLLNKAADLLLSFSVRIPTPERGKFELEATAQARDLFGEATAMDVEAAFRSDDLEAAQRVAIIMTGAEIDPKAVRAMPMNKLGVGYRSAAHIVLAAAIRQSVHDAKLRESQEPAAP